MSKTTIIVSFVFLIISILVNIFASVLEKIVEKKKRDTIKNSNDMENEKNEN